MEPIAYSAVSAIEDRHWWYVTRRRLFALVIDNFVPTGQISILDVGCGCGGNLPLLSEFGEVSAIEPDEYCRNRAAARGRGPIEWGALPDNLPYDKDFDLICLFDVLEHIDDDSAALRNLHRILRPNGRIVITVPAFPLLWSGLDESAHHKRRYTKDGLVSLAEAAGFRVQYSTYFNTILSPAILAVRLFQRLLPRPALDSYFKLPNKTTNFVFGYIFSLERFLIPRFSLPFGVSLMLLGTAG